MQQRQQTYKDLLHALQVMRIVDNNTQKPQLFLAMYLIETGNLKYDTNLQVSNSLFNTSVDKYTSIQAEKLIFDISTKTCVSC